MCANGRPGRSDTLTLVGIYATLILAANVHAQVLYVDDDAALGGDGVSWDTPFKCLQDALSAAADDPGITEIRVAQGTYKPDQDEAGNVTPGDREATFQLLSGLTLAGGYAGLADPNDPDARDIELYETILSGDLAGDDAPDFENYDENSYHVLTAIDTEAPVTLDGLVVTAGHGNGSLPHRCGAGVYCDNADVALVDCVVTECRVWKLSAFPLGAAVYVRDGSASFTSCLMADNYAFFGGGAVFGSWAHLSFVDCQFSNNQANRGGAIYASSAASVVIANCEFVQNTGRNVGGGAFINYADALWIRDCDFLGDYCTDHYIPWGAGLAVRNSRGTVEGCLFRDNWTRANNASSEPRYASAAGLSVKGDVTVANCLFVGNSSTNAISGGEAFAGAASFGHQTKVYDCTFINNWTDNIAEPTSAGGGVVFLGSAALTNCAFIANEARCGTGRGGAVYVREGVPTLTNCTFVANTAFECGGVGATLDTKLTNCIAWGNTDDSGSSESAQVFGSPIVNYCCIEGWTGDLGGVGNIGDDPLFVDPDGPDDIFGTEDDDVRLLPGSPCIDAGCNGAVPRDWADLDDDGDTSETTPLDLDGEGRFFDDPNTDDTGCCFPPIVDMGAYEFGDAGPLPCRGDLNGDRVIGQSDLGILLAAWQLTDGGDLDCDGDTDQSDLGILLANWGNICP